MNDRMISKHKNEKFRSFGRFAVAPGTQCCQFVVCEVIGCSIATGRVFLCVNVRAFVLREYDKCFICLQ